MQFKILNFSAHTHGSAGDTKWRINQVESTNGARSLQLRHSEIFEKEEHAVEYYNLLIKDAVERKQRKIEQLKYEMERFEKFLYIDGKSPVVEKKTKKSNLVI